jgi:single-stranded-DNA-specific exonuclease
VAAGLSLERKNLESFRERFAAKVREQLDVLLENGVDALARKVEIDAKLDLPTLLSTLDLNTVKIIEKLAPFGIGNPEPVLSAEGFRIEESRTMKEKHLKLQLEADGNFVSAFWANGVERFESSLEENEVELAFSPTINTFRNQNNVEFRVKDIRALSH